MSGLGGVGINLAVQDAAAAARILSEPLRGGRVTEKELAAVQRRRMFPAAVTQRAQIIAHRRVVDPVFATGTVKASSWVLSLFARLPRLSSLPARFVGMGVRPEHAPAFARRAGATINV